ncbi:MAG: hypothetical protein NC110_03075 [Ruminococcus sp.]|nr:hypothetical protein [Ruminococcus sp.]
MFFFKNFLRIIMSVMIAVLSIIPAQNGLADGVSISFDAQQLTGEVTSGASGYLYGISEDGVPSDNMIESLDISSVSAKTQGGLQHPIGEVGDVSNFLASSDKCDYIVVYLQDMYSTWYYEEGTIAEMKKSGEYNWKTFLETSYFPLVKKTIEQMQNQYYSDKLVFCIFNECDNGVWFGDWSVKDGNVSNKFNLIGKKNFNEAWKMTYDYVKSLAPDVLIGGPGNCDYDLAEMSTFLGYASVHDCVPDVMIYHELNNRSLYDWEANAAQLRELEKAFGIDPETPIIVTEYGRMQDNGNPNNMLKYIACCENSKVYANQAYWLLANNLCNTAADYNTPNSAWWVYRWYTSMDGQTMQVDVSDVLHADVGKAILQMREPRNPNLLGLGSITDAQDKIKLLVPGTDYDYMIKINNLENTALYGENVKITVYASQYQGISGEVYAPEIVKSYVQKCEGTIRIKMNPNKNTAYYVEIEKADDDIDFINDNLYTRFEFEEGALLGSAYTYKSAYASTGGENGLVGGMEKDGDGVEIKINVPESGDYELRFIYGNSNDGSTYTDRTHSDVNFIVDGSAQVISLENTIKSELTSTFDTVLALTEGEHTVSFTHNKGTIVLDSVLVRKAENNTRIYTELDDDRDYAYLAVAPSDGFYKIKTAENTVMFVDGAKVHADENGEAVVYLRRGINYIDTEKGAQLSACVCNEKGEVITLLPEDAQLYGNARLLVNNKLQTKYITGITSDSGSASYKVSAPKAGTYKLTINYASNHENGVHSYNVDLVDDFVTISVNGEKQMNLYCRSTYSSDTYTTVTTNIELQKGENVLTFSNDGANKFNGNLTYAPDIATVTVNSPAK